MEEYDLEVVVLGCKKLHSRMCDFKKYGILNIKEKRVKINVIVSNDEDIPGLENNWPDDVDINVVKYSNPNYVQNLYKFFLEYDLNSKSRWIIKLDDDSATDVSGLIENLDKFYDYNEPYYLAASCSKFMGPEYWVGHNYLDVMEEYGPLIFHLQHEIECSVISRKAIQKILKNKKSINLLKRRSELEHKGATDVVLALASSMSKVYPIDCPFLTHTPELDKFSMLPRGFRNHIHLISRDLQGENFLSHERSNHLFTILTRVADGITSQIEKKMEGKKINIQIYKNEYEYVFKPNHILERLVGVRFEPNFSYSSKCLVSNDEIDSLLWFEEDETIKIVGKKGIVKEFKYEGKNKKFFI